MIPHFLIFLASLTHHLSVVKFSEKINVRTSLIERAFVALSRRGTVLVAPERNSLLKHGLEKLLRLNFSLKLQILFVVSQVCSGMRGMRGHLPQPSVLVWKR